MVDHTPNDSLWIRSLFTVEKPGSRLIRKPSLCGSIKYKLPFNPLKDSEVYEDSIKNDYAKSHVQFRDKKMTPLEVIDFIAEHDAWRNSHK